VARELRDSRRLTGPNVLGDLPGPVVDIALPDDERAAAVAAWEPHARAVAAGLGWTDAVFLHRIFPGGVSLHFSAPVDVLYAACEANEWAWSAAEADLDGRASAEPLPTALERLRALVREERNPPVLRMQRAAARHGQVFLWDDDHVSVGLGGGSRTWSVDDLPEAGDVDWEDVCGIPAAMVTGTNGKTTTVRLLAAMAAAAGRTVGVSSTDWLRVGSDMLDRGDWSGPGGARTVLRDPRTEIAVLETARGGMLRRGLALGPGEADVVAVLNVAADHLGEWGVQDLDMLADTKFVIRRAGRRVVLNADCPQSVARRGLVEAPVDWFSLDPGSPVVAEHLAAGGRAWLFDGDALLRAEGSTRTVITRAEEIPATLGGAARHNVANALAACACAEALGLPNEAMVAGLRGFRSSPSDNPGRLNLFEFGGVKAVVDFAHNPHGLEALFDMAGAMPAERRLVVIGHAGDRDDEAIAEVARTAWAARPDRILVKEQSQHLRGREPGDVVRLLVDALREAGAPEEAYGVAGDELEAVRQALEWARPGDLLLLLILAEREAVLARLGALQLRGWKPGEPLSELS